MIDDPSPRTAVAEAEPIAPDSGPRAIPNDPKLPQLAQAFDSDWAWQRFCETFGPPEAAPDRVRVQHFIYRPGSRAVVGYVAEKRWDDWLVEDHFAFELLAGREERLFRFPDDPYLPGLALMAEPLSAHELLPLYVPLHPHRLVIETVRYRPTQKAVLRHHARWRRREMDPVLLYCRVVPPDRVERLLTAGELVGRSGFTIPRLAGHYREGGVIWIAGVPGKTVRVRIREGKAPPPEQIVEGLEPLWRAPAAGGQPLDVAGGLRHTERILSEVLPGGPKHPGLERLLRVLRPFAEDWKPSALAHNDFYDDQLIVTPDRRIALVDFEEAGPGDPMIDIGNMLAHLDWMGRFSRGRKRYAAYHDELREAALGRLEWDARALALREAYALFRLASNPVRHFRDNSLEKVETVLGLALEVLEGRR